MKKFLALLLFAGALPICAQQPQTQTAPLSAINAKYVNGVAPGYWATPGSGLTLNVSAGTTNCAGTIDTYSGGTLTMTASTTNYIYLNTAASCVPAVKTTAFTSSDIPLAVVVTSGSAITGIVDDRTQFQTPGSGSGGSVCGSSGQLQYNNSGACGGTGGVTFPGTGKLALASTDPFNPGATNSYFQSIVNTMNVQTEFEAEQGSNDAINGVVGGVTGTYSGIHQANGVAGFVNNSAGSGLSFQLAGVGGYFQARCTGINSACFGSNPLAASSSSLSGVSLTGEEVNVNASNTSDTVKGVYLVGASTATPTADAPGFVLGPLGTSIKWSEGFKSLAGAAAIAFFAGPTATSGSSLQSQSIDLQSVDSGGTARDNLINADASGNVVIAPYSGLTKITGNVAVSGISSGTAPVCANGSGGALTTSGCSVANMNYTGSWSSSTTYAPGMVVTYSSHAYLCIGSVSPTISNVQNAAEAGSNSLAFTSSVTSGNLIVVAYASESNITSRTISDTLSTSFTRVGYTSGNSNDIAIYVGVAPSSGADTITFNAGASYPKITISEFSGLSGTVNTSSFVFQSSGSPVTTSITTTAATEVYEAVASYSSSSTFTTVSGEPMTITAQANGADAIAGAFGTYSSSGTYTVGLNLTSPGTTPIGVIAFTSGVTAPSSDTTHWLLL